MTERPLPHGRLHRHVRPDHAGPSRRDPPRPAPLRAPGRRDRRQSQQDVALRRRGARRDGPARRRPFPNVSVESFEGLTVQYVRRIGARVILRGLRTLSDMEYEFGMTLTNHRLDPDDRDRLPHGRRRVLARLELADQAGRRATAGPRRCRRFVPEELIAPILAKLGASRTCRDRTIAAAARAGRDARRSLPGAGMKRSRDHCRRPRPRDRSASCRS